MSELDCITIKQILHGSMLRPVVSDQYWLERIAIDWGTLKNVKMSFFQLCDAILYAIALQKDETMDLSKDYIRTNAL